MPEATAVPGHAVVIRKEVEVISELSTALVGSRAPIVAARSIVVVRRPVAAACCREKY